MLIIDDAFKPSTMVLLMAIDYGCAASAPLGHVAYKGIEQQYCSSVLIYISINMVARMHFPFEGLLYSGARSNIK